MSIYRAVQTFAACLAILGSTAEAQSTASPLSGHLWVTNYEGERIPIAGRRVYIIPGLGWNEGRKAFCSTAATDGFRPGLQRTMDTVLQRLAIDSTVTDLDGQFSFTRSYPDNAHLVVADVPLRWFWALRLTQLPVPLYVNLENVVDPNC